MAGFISRLRCGNIFNWRAWPHKLLESERGFGRRPRLKHLPRMATGMKFRSVDEVVHSTHCAMATLLKAQEHLVVKQQPLDGTHGSPALGASFLLPAKPREDGSVPLRASFVASLHTEPRGQFVEEKFAVTFHDLVIIRAANGSFLRDHPSILGTALGLRVKGEYLPTRQPSLFLCRRNSTATGLSRLNCYRSAFGLKLDCLAL